MRNTALLTRLLPLAILGCDFSDICESYPDLCDPGDPGGGDTGGDTGGTDPGFCGGIAGFPCPDGLVCVDDPNDDCDPAQGGADCGGMCVEPVFCGGIAGIPCSEGLECIDDPRDDCDPLHGGADCGGLCVEPAAPTCEEIVTEFEDETAAIRSCESDDECGQELTGTSCGCTRNWVARADADINAWEAVRARARDLGCELPGTISTCDCPPADGFACVEGVCTWSYL